MDDDEGPGARLRHKRMMTISLAWHAWAFGVGVGVGVGRRRRRSRRRRRCRVGGGGKSKSTGVHASVQGADSDSNSIGWATASEVGERAQRGGKACRFYPNHLPPARACSTTSPMLAGRAGNKQAWQSMASQCRVEIVGTRHWPTGRQWLTARRPHTCTQGANHARNHARWHKTLHERHQWATTAGTLGS